MEILVIRSVIRWRTLEGAKAALPDFKVNYQLREFTLLETLCCSTQKGRPQNDCKICLPSCRFQSKKYHGQVRGVVACLKSDFATFLP